MPLIPFVRMSTCSSNLLSCFSAACAAVLAIALGAVCPSARAQTGTVTHPAYTYAVTDLGTLPGGTHSESYAINESGDVAGDSLTSTGGDHATLFKAGKVIDLGVLPGGSYSVGYGLNGYDEVTGSAQFPVVPDSPRSYHAFLYRAGKMQDIGTLSGDDVSGAGAINDAGQITGVSMGLASPSDPVPNNHGFLYRAGTMTNLAGSYGDSIQTAGQGINSFGQVAGWVALSGYPLPQEAAVFSNGSIMPLGMLPGGYSSEAVAINDFGQVAGYSYLNFEEALHAFLYSKDKMIDLGTLPGDSISVAYSINVSGQVVGNSLTPLTGHPFLYRHGHMLNLNSLLPAGSGWTLDSAWAINDKGQITGTGTNPQGFFHAYLLSPVFQSFCTLNTVAGIIGKPGTTFAGGGTIVLGAKSNGIYPLAETTVFQLGGYHISIPPKSFVKINGVYFYQGKIGNATVYAAIRPMGSNTYLVGVVGEGVTGLPTSYPYNLTVTIGDDTGTQAITWNYDISALTEAEVCRDFGLPCK